MKVLFGRDKISGELSFDTLKPLLPGWQLAACRANKVIENLDGVDVVCPLGARIDARIIAAGSFGLVHQFGVGLDSVDVEAATEHGVWAARADLARPTGRSLLDSTVLIVGLGAIGTALARRLAPSGPRLIGRRGRPELGGPAEVEFVGGPERLPELLGQADAVMCCAELHAGNARMFGPAEFAAMRPGALFVNVARGGLVDEDALLAALRAGQVGGAGLDVFAREPVDPASPLVTHPRVIATPHVGWHTGYMFRQTSAAFAANLQRYARGEQPLGTVNQPRSRRAR